MKKVKKVTDTIYYVGLIVLVIALCAVIFTGCDSTDYTTITVEIEPERVENLWPYEPEGVRDQRRNFVRESFSDLDSLQMSNTRYALIDSLQQRYEFTCYGGYSNSKHYKWHCVRPLDDIGYYYDIGQIDQYNQRDSIVVSVWFYGHDGTKDFNPKHLHGPYHFPQERALEYYQSFTAIKRYNHGFLVKR